MNPNKTQLEVKFEGLLLKELLKRAKKDGFEFSEAFWLRTYLTKKWYLSNK